MNVMSLGEKAERDARAERTKRLCEGRGMMGECTWKKVAGKWQCQAKQCVHWAAGGVCKIGKVSLTCDNNECVWNKERVPGIYGCHAMDVHLDADGRCLSLPNKKE